MKEILFAQRLADNEKRIRDRALKKLRKYLSIKSSGGAAIPGDDALKLWKGLFYCMYMADKPLVQESVAEDISGLIHYINNEEDCKSFVRAGFLTFAREWNGIDVFRIDKFMMFVRRFLRHIFTHLQATNWSLKNVMAYMSILETTVILPDDNVNNTPLGLKTHVCEVILEELAKVGGDNLEHSVIMAVVQPYFKVLALTKTNAYVKFVREGIIHHLIQQSLCTEEEEVEEEQDNSTLLTHDATLKEEEDATFQQQIPEEMEVSLDPRAGRVDAYIPQLKVDLNLLADSLQKVGSVSRVQTRNREVIYRLVCELRDAAQGHNPLALPSDHVDDVEVPDTEVERAVDRLEKFEDDLRAGIKPENEESDDIKPVKKRQFKSKYQKKKYRLKKKKQRPKGLPKAKRRKLDRRQNELCQKRTLAVDHMVRQVTAAAGVPKSSVVNNLPDEQMNASNGFLVSPISQKKMPNSSKALVNNFTVEVTSRNNKKRMNVENEGKTRKKKCFDVSVLDFEMGTCAEAKSAKEKEKVDAGLPSEGQAESKKINENSNLPPGLSSKDHGKKNKRVKKSDNVLITVPNEDKPKKSIKIRNDVKKNENVPTSVATEAKSKKRERKKSANVGNSVPKQASLCNGKTPVTAQKSEPIEKDKTNTQPKHKITLHTKTKPANKGLVIQFSETKRQKALEIVTQKSPWDLPLEKGEYEIYIKSKKLGKKTKQKELSPIKRRLSSGTPRQRTISINLKKNKEHEFSDYVRTLRASPSIPFKADRTPKAPVLKPSPSPILVKRSLLRKRLKKRATSASPQLSFRKKRATAADFF